MVDAADRVAAALDEIRERVGAIKAIRAQWTPHGETIGSGMAGEWVIANLASASDVPALLTAVEAVLGFCAEHENIRGIFGDLAEVPIPPSEIRRVIAVALLGEEPGT
jgi:hypothetical protein